MGGIMSDQEAPVLAGVHHLKLPVTDLARSREWYRSRLGYQVQMEFVERVRLMGDGSPCSGSTTTRRSAVCRRACGARAKRTAVPGTRPSLPLKPMPWARAPPGLAGRPRRGSHGALAASFSSRFSIAPGGRRAAARSGGRQGKGHLGSLARLAAGCEAAAVRTGQLGRDGQPDAAAGDLRRLPAAPEAVEDVRQVLGRDAHAG